MVSVIKCKLQNLLRSEGRCGHVHLKKKLITHQSILMACSQGQRTIAEDRFPIQSQQHWKDNRCLLGAEHKLDIIEQSVMLI